MIPPGSGIGAALPVANLERLTAGLGKPVPSGYGDVPQTHSEAEARRRTTRPGAPQIGSRGRSHQLQHCNSSAK